MKRPLKLTRTYMDGVILEKTRLRKWHYYIVF